jgi:SAM-dependent methyltransferase
LRIGAESQQIIEKFVLGETELSAQGSSNKTDSVQNLYDSMAHEYDALYGDWRAEVRRQGPILGALIRARARTATAAKCVLDATCGIGTQAIALALAGFQVHATDLSPAAVARALKEAAALGVTLTGGAAFLRALDRAVSDQFDRRLHRAPLARAPGVPLLSAGRHRARLSAAPEPSRLTASWVKPQNERECPSQAQRS